MMTNGTRAAANDAHKSPAASSGCVIPVGCGDERRASKSVERSVGWYGFDFVFGTLTIFFRAVQALVLAPMKFRRYRPQ